MKIRNDSTISRFASIAFASCLWSSLAQAQAQAQAATDTVLYTFDGTDSYSPGALTLGQDGYLYSPSRSYGLGPVFRFSSDGSLQTIGISASPHTYSPDQLNSPLVQGADGRLYATALSGGAGYRKHEGMGAVLAFSTAGGTIDVLNNFYYNYEGWNRHYSRDGVRPLTGLTAGSDGNFYGITSSGGTYDRGTIYVVTAAGQFTTLYAFGDSLLESGALMQASDGNLYAIAAVPGAVYRITPSGTVSILYSFSATDGAAGSGPALVQGADGALYGATSGGGANGTGTLFRLTLDGGFTVLHNFSAEVQVASNSFNGYVYENTDGFGVSGPLTIGSDGNFYGTTTGGGANGVGTIFKLTPNGGFTVLHNFGAPTNAGWSFTYVVNADGAGAIGSLIEIGSLVFYGTCSVGGTSGYGVFYKLTIGS